MLIRNFEVIAELAMATEATIEKCARAITDYLSLKMEKTVARKELFEALAGEYSRATIDRALKYMFNAGRLIKVARGFYALPTTLDSEIKMGEQV